MKNELKADLLISTFIDSVKNDDRIDSFMSSLSDDESAITYSISRFFQIEDSCQFNLFTFYKKIKEQYFDSIQNIDGNSLSISREIGEYTLFIDIDVFEDNSIMLEMHTVILLTASDTEFIKKISEYMLEEFSEVLTILSKTKTTN